MIDERQDEDFGNARGSCANGTDRATYYQRWNAGQEFKSVPENQISTSEEQTNKTDARCDHYNI
jgi:hypothetical protein